MKWLIYKTKWNSNVYPFWNSIPSHQCGSQLLYPPSSQYTQHTTSHSSLITIAQNNCVVCPSRAANIMSSSRMNETKTINYLSDCFSLISPFFFFQKCAYISFETDSNISENSIFLVWAWLVVKAVKYIEVLEKYEMKFGNCYWTDLLSILHSGCWLVREDVLP